MASTQPTPPQPTPSFAQASLCFMVVLAIISSGLFILAVDLHALMFICLLWTGVNARILGFDYDAIRQMIIDAVSKALPAIFIFILIGMVIASFMHSGTIAAMMYFGLDWLGPKSFLPVGLILCAMMSLATGTSWGTVGTLGVVFMGIGATMGLPLALIAGMVISGATFGDKLSPMSDTTNLAAMSAGTDLYRHIYAMLFTTLPTFIIVLGLFYFLGQDYGATSLQQQEIAAIQQALGQEYRLSPFITLLPIILMLMMSMGRIAAEVTMSASILLAVLIAVVYQQHNGVEVLNALWLNSAGDTGIQALDELLGRGGISSMSWTLLLALLALALGGVLHGAGFLKVLLGGIISRVRKTWTLLATTMVSGLLGNMAMGEAYISIILNCQLFRQRYKEQGLDMAILSRSVEEGSTLTTGLIPWTTAGAFYTATLGVPTLDYAMYAFFNYFNGFVSLFLAAVGLGLLRKKGRSIERTLARNTDGNGESLAEKSH